MTNKTISRALISVSDKTGLLALARTLAGLKVEILSTGGSASLLEENDIPVTRVSEFTGQEEIMDGRVKTLHPKIHGGILARRDQDQEIMHEQGISGIDLVVVNLYPFSQTIAQPNCSFEDAIENIDIGGPTMVRAAAKNHHDVVIITDPSDYEQLSETLTKNNTATDDAFRFKMAAKAFAHTAAYDAAISQYLNAKMDASQADAEKQTAAFPAQWQMSFTLSESLRYGENPHQQAAFYHQQTIPAGSISAAKQVQGKALSFNNIADADTALECVKQFDQPACVIVKHANPCGAAQADTVLNAYQLAFATDKESAFGGIIAINKTLEADLAQAIIDQQFVEVIIAPDISAAAQKVLQAKANVRALVCGEMTLGSMQEDIKRVNGGLLVQSADAALYDALTVATKTQPTEQQLLDCEFAFKVAKFVKSNAIVYANKNQTIGVGAGQMSRINSARIASIKADHAGLQVAGSVMASDAFFPFKDGIEQAAQDGIAAIIQPGGSIRDDEVIQAADDAGIAMVFTGMRHFRH